MDRTDEEPAARPEQAEQADASEPQASATARPLSGRWTFLVLAIVGVGLALRAWALDAAYFIEDDFLFFGRAYNETFSWDYLLDLHKGHLMPGAMLLVYVHTALTPYSWAAVSVVMLAMQAGAWFGLLAVLREVFGERRMILVPFVVFVFAPFTLPVLVWWSAALNAVPLQLAIVLALLWTVRHLRSGDRRHAWAAWGATAFGMAFAVKAMLLPLVLFAVTVLFFQRGRMHRAILAALDARPRLWAGMAVLMVGHLAVYLIRQRGAGDDGAGMPDAEVSLGLARAMLGEVFPLGTVGGPWVWGPVAANGGLVMTSALTVTLAWLLFGLIVAGTLWWRPRAWRAWALLAGYVVFVDLLPTLIARGRYLELVGYDPRYIADAALIFAVCLAFALLPTTEERAQGIGYRRTPPRGRRAGIAALAAGLAFTASGAASMLTYTETLSGDRVRWYLDTVRASTDSVPPDAAVYPHPVPEDIVLPWNGPLRLSSYVLPPLAEDGTAERIAAPHPAQRPMMFNEAGFLVDAQPDEHALVIGPQEDNDRECVNDEDGRLHLPLDSPGGATHAVGLAYTAQEETFVAASTDQARIDAVLPAAPGGGAFYLPLDAPGSELLLESDPRVCVTLLSYGPLVPSAVGDPLEEEAEDAGDEEEEDAEEDEDAADSD
jgi:hypothetical protein